jgi:PAS domain S-box-containing protein
MDYKLEDLIDIPFFQDLLDKLNEISPFPSAIIDIEGKILTATAWQPICTKFHRINAQSEKECLVSDQYILAHIDEANPAVSYRCPHGMIDNAIPIIIGGKHLANFFTGQFFLEPPDLDFFKKQAVKYGFDKTSYLEAVRKTPVWSNHQLNKYIEFIHPFVHSMADMGLTRLQDLENKKFLEDSELRYRDLFETAPVMYVITYDVNGLPVITDCNQKFLDALGYKRIDVLGKELTDFYTTDSKIEFLQKGGYQRSTSGGSLVEERELICKNGTLLTCLVWARPEVGPGGNVTGLRAAYMDISHRKETEQALQDSDLRYSATVDALGDGIHVVDEDLTIQLCNASMSKWVQELGYSGILAGKNLFKAFPFLPESVREEYQQVFRGRKTLITEEISKAGGREIQTETRKIPIVKNDRVARVVTVVRDISQQKQAEKALQESQEQLRIIASNTPDHIVMQDKELRYRMVINPQLGLTKEDMLGKTDHDFLLKEEADKLTEAKLSVLSGGNPLHFETSLNSKKGETEYFDGEYIPMLDDKGQTEGLIGYFRNVTERKIAEQAIKNSEEKFKATFMTSQDGVYMATLDEGLIVETNEAFEGVFGYPRDEVIGKTSLELNMYEDPDDRAKIVAELKTKGRVQEVEVKGRKKGGEIIFCSLSISVVQIKDKAHIVGVIRDISARKQTEHDLQERLKELTCLSEIRNATGLLLSISELCGMVVEKVVLAMQYPDLTAAKIDFDGKEYYTNRYKKTLPRGIHADIVIKGSKRGQLSVFYTEDRDFLIPEEQNLVDAITGELSLWLAKNEAEQELKQAKNYWQSLVENTSDLVTLLDANAVIRYQNPAVEKILGYKPDEVIGKKISELVHPQDWQRVWDIFIEYVNTSAVKPPVIEFRLQARDGSWQNMEATSDVRMDETGQPYAVLTSRDISERVQTMKMIEKTNERLSLAQEASLAGSYDWDITNDTFVWSPEFKQLFGLSPETVAGFEAWKKALHPDDVEQASQKIQESINQKINLINDYRIILPDGSLRWIRARGKVYYDGKNPVRMTGLCMDITPLMQIKQTLSENLQNLQTVLDGIQESILLVERDGKILAANETVAKRFGKKPVDLVGTNTLDLVDKTVSIHRKKFMEQVISSGQPLRFEDERGDRIIDNAIYPIFDENGKVVRLVIFGQDITERRRDEKGLKESESRFRAIIEASPVPYALNDDQQNITFLNHSFVNTFGYTLEDIPTLAEWWPKAYPDEEYRQWVASTWQEHLDLAKKTNSPFEAMELNIHCKDGSYRTALIGAALLEDALTGVHLVILYDITERKQAEQLLEAERNFATQVMNSMGQGLTVTDERGCFEYVNTAYAAIIGYEPNDLLGKRPEEITSPDDIEILKEASLQRKRGESTTYETRLKHKDGHEVHVMITGVPRWRTGKVSGTIAVVTDLTERNMVEEVLRESESQYRQRVNELQTIMDTIPVVLWVAHDPLCKVIKGNRAAYELHQLPMDSNASLTSPEGQQIIHSKVFHNGAEIAGSDLPLQVSASKGIEISDYEEEVVFNDGRVLYEIGNTKPLFDETGKPRGAVGAFINITERKQAENEVSKRAKELDALQKIILDITASQNVPGLLESIVARACQLVGAPCGAMYLSDLKKQEVKCVVSYNTSSDYTGTILKFGEGVAGKIAQTGQSMNIPNYQTWAGRSQIFEQEKPFSAILGVPLIWGGHVSGVIDMMQFEKESTFKQEDMEVLNLFAGHAAIAIENTRLLQEAISRNEEVLQLSIRLEEAEENERRRIARELHDQVGQSLSALSINLNIVHSQMPEYLPGFKRRLEDSLMLIDQTTDNIRSLMSELRPAVLDDYGLKAAMDWAATAIARRTELKVVVEGECKRFEPRVEIALFRIAQEALANVSRHAQAKYVKILLDQNGPDFSMSIADDGIGLGTTLSLESKAGGMGMRLMRERAEAIGGSLQIESSHVLGTKITVKYHDQDPAGR